jgi:hypothetical protein
LFEVFQARSASEHWRSALGFVFSKKLHDAETQAVGLLEKLLQSMADDDFNLAVVAAECVDSIRGKGMVLRPDLATRLRDICLAAIERDIEVKDRAQLGIALGKLGDPRIHSARDPAAYVTAYNPFLKYPVTNSQFQEFIDDHGYERPDDFWSPEGKSWLAKENATEPALFRSSKWNAPNQPVVGVSFWEAEAFAKWAGGRLPTEHEWEAAARGPNGLVYPWGNEEEWQDGICNTRESGLLVTSAVGLFPRSRSKPFGLEDMAGNVWQWCSGPTVGVLRGGAWCDDRDYACTTTRDWNHPEDRDNNVGFRVVRTNPDGLPDAEPTTRPHLS